MRAISIVAMLILLRFLLSHPFVWADEVASWLFVWVIFRGSSVLVRPDSHLTVEIIVDRLSGRVNLWRKLIVNLVVSAILCILFRESTGYWRDSG